MHLPCFPGSVEIREAHTIATETGLCRATPSPPHAQRLPTGVGDEANSPQSGYGSMSHVSRLLSPMIRPGVSSLPHRLHNLRL